MIPPLSPSSSDGSCWLRASWVAAVNTFSIATWTNALCPDHVMGLVACCPCWLLLLPLGEDTQEKCGPTWLGNNVWPHYHLNSDGILMVLCPTGTGTFCKEQNQAQCAQVDLPTVSCWWTNQETIPEVGWVSTYAQLQFHQSRVPGPIDNWHFVTLATEYSTHKAFWSFGTINAHQENGQLLFWHFNWSLLTKSWKKEKRGYF